MFSFFLIKLEFEWFSLIALIFNPFDSFNQIQPEAVKHCKFSDQVQKLLIIKNHDFNPAKVDLNQFHILLIAFSVTCCIPVNACAALQCRVHIGAAQQGYCKYAFSTNAVLVQIYCNQYTCKLNSVFCVQYLNAIGFMFLKMYSILF